MTGIKYVNYCDFYIFLKIFFNLQLFVNQLIMNNKMFIYLITMSKKLKIKLFFLNN